MKFIIGVKERMTQVFDANGRVHPVTIIRTVNNTVTQVKGEERDGYRAVQIGVGEKKEKRVSKPQKKKGAFSFFREFRVEAPENYSTSGNITSDIFKEGEKISVSSISKAKGFQGVVKRHGFAGGRRTHGQKHSEREPGSIGGGPGRAGGRVVKGMRMAGRMGGERVTVSGLSIVKISPETGEIFVRGAVPGRRGTYVEIVSKEV